MRKVLVVALALLSIGSVAGPSCAAPLESREAGGDLKLKGLDHCDREPIIKPIDGVQPAPMQPPRQGPILHGFYTGY